MTTLAELRQRYDGPPPALEREMALTGQTADQRRVLKLIADHRHMSRLLRNAEEALDQRRRAVRAGRYHGQKTHVVKRLVRDAERYVRDLGEALFRIERDLQSLSALDPAALSHPAPDGSRPSPMVDRSGSP